MSTHGSDFISLPWRDETERPVASCLFCCCISCLVETIELHFLLLTLFSRWRCWRWWKVAFMSEVPNWCCSHVTHLNQRRYWSMQSFSPEAAGIYEPLVAFSLLSIVTIIIDSSSTPPLTIRKRKWGGRTSRRRLVDGGRNYTWLGFAEHWWSSCNPMVCSLKTDQ